MFPGLENENMEDRSLFEVLRQKYFVHPAWTEAAVEASSATSEHARLLESIAVTPELMEIGWQCQELRVQLFAQPLGTREPVSVKRIARALREAELA